LGPKSLFLNLQQQSLGGVYKYTSQPLTHNVLEAWVQKV
jgi:hypothetical protein